MRGFNFFFVIAQIKYFSSLPLGETILGKSILGKTNVGKSMLGKTTYTDCEFSTKVGFIYKRAFAQSKIFTRAPKILH